MRGVLKVFGQLESFRINSVNRIKSGNEVIYTLRCVRVHCLYSSRHSNLATSETVNNIEQIIASIYTLHLAVPKQILSSRRLLIQCLNPRPLYDHNVPMFLYRFSPIHPITCQISIQFRSSIPTSDTASEQDYICADLTDALSGG